MYMNLWEVVINSKSIDRTDFQKNLSRGSLFLEGHLVKFVSYVVTRIAPTYTKLWEVVNNSKSMDGIDFQKNLSRGSLFLEGDFS